MKIKIPELSLVVLIGTSGSGKSTFARKHFKPTEVISSDFCRGLVSDDENDQAATRDAFDVLHYIAAKRLDAARLTVVDATNVQPESRKPLVALARAHDCLPVAIVLNTSPRTCQDRNKARQDRDFGEHVIRIQSQQLKRGLRGLEKEGFRHVFVVNEEDIDNVEIERQKLWNNLQHESGPFDIIGDIHGCYDELEGLLIKLGYSIKRRADAEAAEQYFASETFSVSAPAGRKVIFLGDLCDRGPKTPEVLKLVMSMVAGGTALCVPGNHDVKLMKKFKGRDVRLTHGLPESLEQLAPEREELKTQIVNFVDSLVSHYVLDKGNLVVAHAGMKEAYQGRGSGRVREFALYGETTGETDEYGLPVRFNWAAEYRGRAHVVYGHTPVAQAEWINRTICLDTGCVFGGKLTALRYPEKELVSVPAARVYYEPSKPLFLHPAPLERGQDDMLDIEDVSGKRIIETRLMRNVMVREENSIAALEIMSRFAANPQWLIYLPPTMSPTETTQLEGYLEHPIEAFNHFRDKGVGSVICEEKHMGSRAVLIVCKDDSVPGKRFGVNEKTFGMCCSRTGRPFFNDKAMEAEFLDRLSRACTRANIWERFDTEWILLDCEIMPWSLKAQELLRDQYAAVGTAGGVALTASSEALARARARGLDIGDLGDRFIERRAMVDQFTAAYRRYCWPVRGIEDVKVAPFHLMATEGAVHTDKNHAWHMEELARLAQVDEPIITATRHKFVELADAGSVAAAVDWWLDLTGAGGEGMVVKPMDFITYGNKGLLQPAIKCRGREYLRIIYGPEYTTPEHLEKLRRRSLAVKRSLALREFALGLEALERFVAREPLYRVHECVFGVLAMESEPVDPRL
ncbi:MAG: polynucleotide kinase-phosphatase [Cyanobacteria bacterium SZAS LIN-3]|nr:polynucleotide kinase-phosphatase [Cyanobacteria bacterium SZAS LIN-3]